MTFAVESSVEESGEPPKKLTKTTVFIINVVIIVKSIYK